MVFIIRAENTQFAEIHFRFILHMHETIISISFDFMEILGLCFTLTLNILTRFVIMANLQSCLIFFIISLSIINLSTIIHFCHMGSFKTKIILSLINRMSNVLIAIRNTLTFEASDRITEFDFYLDIDIIIRIELLTEVSLISPVTIVTKMSIIPLISSLV